MVYSTDIFSTARGERECDLSAYTQAPSVELLSTQAIMIDDSAPHRVFKIAELARPIANQLVLAGQQKSAVNLARVCRCLEEPVLSTLWATELSLRTLLMVLPRKNRYSGWNHVVCWLGFRLEEQIAECRVIAGRSASWGIRRRRLGPESGATRLGCAGSGRTTRPSSGWTPSGTNYASTHPPVDGSQRCGTYIGALQNPISLTPTCSSPRT